MLAAAGSAAGGRGGPLRERSAACWDRMTTTSLALGRLLLLLSMHRVMSSATAAGHSSGTLPSHTTATISSVTYMHMSRYKVLEELAEMRMGCGCSGWSCTGFGSSR